MKKRKRVAAIDEAPTAFARGFLVTGLLATLQDRRTAGAVPPSARKVLRHAVQGGSALAAASVAAEALARRDYSLAVAAVAAGAAGVLAAEYLLNIETTEEERGLGQEKQEGEAA